MAVLPIRHLLAQSLDGDHEGIESILLPDIYSSGGSRNLSMDKEARVIQILGYIKQNAAAIVSNGGGGSTTPSVSGAVSTGTVESAGSLTFAHTTGAGTNRCLCIGVEYWNGSTNTITGVTYNGIALTLIGTSGNDGGFTTAMYRLLAPPVGAFNIVITGSSGTMYFAATGVPLVDVDPVTPTGAFASATGHSNAPSVNVVSAAGEFVLDSLSWDTAGGVETATIVAGQTQQGNIHSGSVGGASSTKPGAASVTMAWTLSGTARSWAIGGVSFKGTAGGSAAMMLRRIHHYTKQLAGITTRQEIGIFDSQATHWEFRYSTDLGVTWTFVNDFGAASINTIPDFAQIGNLLFMTNGVLAPQQWDGAVLSAAGGTQLAAPAYTKTGAGNLSGNVAFRVVPMIGSTRKLSSVQSINYPVNLETGHVDWAADADVTVTGYEIYRTTGTGSIFFLDGSVVGRLTITFVTNQTDINLIVGRVLQEFGDSPPVGARYCEDHKQRVWYIGTNANPRTAYFSDPGLPASVYLAQNFIDCTDAESWSDNAVGGTGGFGGLLVIWLERSIWVVSGTGVLSGAVVDWVRRRTDAQIGTVHHRTVARIPAGAIYTNEKGEEVRTSAVTLAYLTPLRDVRIFDGNNDTIISHAKRATLSTMNYAQRNKAFCIHDRTRQEIAWVYADGISTEPSTAVVWNYRHGVWFTRDWPFACGIEVESTGSASVLLAGEALTTIGAFCYQLWNGFNFAGAPINSQWMTKTLYGIGSFYDPTGYYGKPLVSLRKRWRWVDLLVSASGGGIVFIVEWIVGDNQPDGAAALANRQFALPGSSLADAAGNLIEDAGGNVLRVLADASLIRTMLMDGVGHYAHSRGLRLRIRASTTTGQWALSGMDIGYQLLPGQTRPIGTVP